MHSYFVFDCSFYEWKTDQQDTLFFFCYLRADLNVEASPILREN